ncbi:MAG: phosphotransferase [Acidobacteriota bacterium]|nr:MAG: phosphotransferase [Acidobacteriota bacterium]
MNTSQQTEREQILLRRFEGDALTRLAPDASTRSFYRIATRARGTMIVLIDETGGLAALDRMMTAGRLLDEIGVRVPRLLERDDALSALVFEDFGSRLLADVWSELPFSEKRRLHGEAAEIAAVIAKRGTVLVCDDHPLACRPLARERLRIELAMFATHDVAGRRGISDRELLRELAELLDRIAEQASLSPQLLAHRDLHSRNLMLLDDGVLGVLDFQDTLRAPMYYDLASLLFDPYVEIGQQIFTASARCYRELTGMTLDPLDDPRLHWVAAQRLLKAIGTYSAQARTAHRPHFLKFIPAAERRAMSVLEGLSDAAAPEAIKLLERVGFAAP